MRAPTSEPLFLARETYRRRRVMDAARFLPFAAIFLFAVPVLWADGTGTAIGMAYLFGLWILLIVLAAAIARALRHMPASPPADPTGDGEAR